MFEKKVIIDTNFLMLPGSSGIDVFSEINRIADFKVQFCVIDKTVDELMGLSMGSKKHALNAKIGIVMLNNNGLRKLSSKDGESVDDAIVRLSSKVEAVATQDRELRERIGSNCRIIGVRGKNHLSFL